MGVVVADDDGQAFLRTARVRKGNVEPVFAGRPESVVVPGSEGDEADQRAVAGALPVDVWERRPNAERINPGLEWQPVEEEFGKGPNCLRISARALSQAALGSAGRDEVDEFVFT